MKWQDISVVCPYPRAMFKIVFLNNRWFKHILSIQQSDTVPLVLWFFSLSSKSSTQKWCNLIARSICKLAETRGFDPCFEGLDCVVSFLEISFISRKFLNETKLN